MSSGLMASAHMRMKQKRERASPASKVSSPSSIASPSSAGVASPRNNDYMNGNNKQNTMRNAPNSTDRGVSQPMQPEHKYASPQQYSPQYNTNSNARQQQNYQQPRTASPSPEAIQGRGNYNNHNLSARNQPSASNANQETYKQQYYKQLQQPPPPPPSTMPPQSRYQGEEPYDSYDAAPRNMPSSYNNGMQPRNENVPPYYQDSQMNPEQLDDEMMMQGGEYEYDTTEDDEVFANEREDIIGPIKLPMSQRTPEYSQPVDEENETISSEIALNGNPTKKKERKSKKAPSDARYFIHNSGSDDAIDEPGNDGEEGGEDENDEVEEERGTASPDRQYNYGDIAAHAGRYAAASQPDSTNPFDDDSSSDANEGQLPKKMGVANSWDEGERNNTSYTLNDDTGRHNNVSVWENDSSSTMQKFDRNSKSWDQENKSSFEQNLWAGSFFGESSGQSKQEEQRNEETPADWDNAEAAQEAPKDRELDAVMDNSYPWKAQQVNNSDAPREYTEQTEAEESDGDSLFEFEKKKANNTPTKDNLTNPKETPNLENVARNLQDDENYQRKDRRADKSPAYQDEIKFRSQGPSSPPRSVGFVGAEGNRVHRYRQDDAHSRSDSGTFDTRDDDDDETDGDTMEDGDTIDNYTLDDATYGESTYAGTIDTSRYTQNTQNDINLMDHVDTAVKAIGSALGGILLLANNAASSLSADLSAENETMQGTSTVGHESETTNAKTAVASEYDWIDYMEKILFPETETTGEETDTQGLSTNGSTLRSNSNTASASASAEDDDGGDENLLQQAMASARAIHHIHGVQFDESQEINVLTDIKFVVVTVELPLGLLFQEHEMGAWVSRVVPEGNGARKEIQPGDQLAAINGKSSAHATIDEVASIISSTPKNEAVELTFLRYVGPLRPLAGAIMQEGFEVTDKNVGKKPKKGLFKKKKVNPPAGNKASLDFSPNQKRAKNIKISMTQEAVKSKSQPANAKQSEKGKSPFKKMFGGKKKS